MIKKISLTLLNATMIFLLSWGVVYGVDIPNFPQCSNPSGTIKSKYDSGTHGIVGIEGTYVGGDVVYQVNENAVVQCFCADSGNGIQTNWWKVPGITEETIKELKALGWIFVPSGSVWSLTNDPYMALNSQYTCKSSSGGGSGGSNTSSSSSSNVLALASTGSTLKVAFFALLGASALLSGVILRRMKN